MFFYLFYFIMIEDALYTAAFCEEMDQLFNAFNSSSLASTSSMRHALTSNSGHVEFLKSKLDWMKSIKSNGIFCQQSFYDCILMPLTGVFQFNRFPCTSMFSWLADCHLSFAQDMGRVTEYLWHGPI